MEAENRAVFLNGKVGWLDDVCAEAVRTMKENTRTKKSVSIINIAEGVTICLK